MKLFPNPTAGRLYADLSLWAGQVVTLQVFDSRGRRLHSQSGQAGVEAQAIELPRGLPAGLYVVKIQTADGQGWSGKFLLQP